MGKIKRDRVAKGEGHRQEGDRSMDRGRHRHNQRSREVEKGRPTKRKMRTDKENRLAKKDSEVNISLS